jgi:hypothetical protein
MGSTPGGHTASRQAANIESPAPNRQEGRCVFTFKLELEDGTSLRSLQTLRVAHQKDEIGPDV